MNKSISFVIPLYNEEKRLEKTFKALERASLPMSLKLEKIIFVNDGSKDTTLDVLGVYKKSSIHKSKIQIVTYKKNRGKGYAIKRGMLNSHSDYTLFFDADMSTPLSELSKFMPFFNDNIDVVIGTRKNGKSTVIKHQPILREFLGKAFTKITQIILGLSVTDFTCGFKAFSKRSLQDVFENSVISGWGYDAEIIFLAGKYGYSISEKAVIWENDERTKVNIFKAVPQTLIELGKIRFIHTLKPTFVVLFNLQKSFIIRMK